MSKNGRYVEQLKESTTGIVNNVQFYHTWLGTKGAWREFDIDVRDFIRKIRPHQLSSLRQGPAYGRRNNKLRQQAANKPTASNINGTTSKTT